MAVSLLAWGGLDAKVASKQKKNSSNTRDITPVFTDMARTLVAIDFKYFYDMLTGNNPE